MRILLCTSEIGDNAGGLAFHCNQLKAIYEKLGHDVLVCLLSEEDEYCVIDGGYDSALGNKIRIAYKLKEMSKNYGEKIDLCVSCGGGASAYKAMLFCKKHLIPMVVVLCGSEVNLACGKAELAFYNMRAFEYASTVIGISKELVENAKILIDNPRCSFEVIPIACNMTSKSGEKEADILDDIVKNRLIFVSGAAFLGEKKGISNLITAFAKLINHKERQDVLYLFGKIDDDIAEQYRALIEKYSLEQNVYLLGYLSRDKFIEKFSESDIYIQASPFEGFGISVAEALCADKDILITDSGYIAEAIKTSFPGHIIHSLNPELLADCIYDFIVSTYPKNEKRKIRELLAESLSESVVVEKWEEVLNKTNVLKSNHYPEKCVSVMFHDVNCSYSGVDYDKEGFEQLLRSVYEKGYKLVSAKEYFDSNCKERQIICTFDDGYENVYVNALPVMKKYGFTATVFVCPDLIGKNNSWNHRDDVNRRHLSHEMINSLVQENWEIGSHGLSHYNMLRLSEHEIDECLSKSRQLLEIYGKIESFCYPYGIFNLYVKSKVRNYYSRAFSVTVGGNNYLDDPYQITRFTPEELLKWLNR